jgi:hypothetical protein
LASEPLINELGKGKEALKSRYMDRDSINGSFNME